MEMQKCYAVFPFCCVSIELRLDPDKVYLYCLKVVIQLRESSILLLKLVSQILKYGPLVILSAFL